MQPPTALTGPTFHPPTHHTLTQAQVLELVRHPRQPHRPQDVVQLAPLISTTQLAQLLPRLQGNRGNIENMN